MDLEQLARETEAILDRSVWDYIAGGADDELTVADNVEAWQRMRLRPRVLRDVTVVGTTTTVLGAPVRVPILVAPTAYHGLVNDQGEVATAQGAAAAGTVMIVSMSATMSLADIAGSATGPRWCQLFVDRDRSRTKEYVQHAVEAGFRALVLTVDGSVRGRRRREERDGFALPCTGLSGDRALSGVADDFDRTITLDVIGWLKHISGLPVVVKGVLRGDDATAVARAGADGVVVSNTGGRQLDTAAATADVLREVVDAVGDAAEVYIDGGIRRGTDVLKALALGARAVLLGRPVLWGLATGGSDGVHAVLDHLGAELERAMTLCGAASIEALGRDLVWPDSGRR